MDKIIWRGKIREKEVRLEEIGQERLSDAWISSIEGKL